MPRNLSASSTFHLDTNDRKNAPRMELTLDQRRRNRPHGSRRRRTNGRRSWENARRSLSRQKPLGNGAPRLRGPLHTRARQRRYPDSRRRTPCSRTLGRRWHHGRTRTAPKPMATTTNRRRSRTKPHLRTNAQTTMRFRLPLYRRTPNNPNFTRRHHRKDQVFSWLLHSRTRLLFPNARACL